MISHMESLKHLIEPKSIAIIGASSDFSRIGGRPIKSLLDFQYKGRILPVNPKYEEIAGLPCFSTIKEISEEVDVAILAVPNSKVLKTVEECGEKGVRSIIVISGGYEEVNEEGANLQEEIIKIAEKYQMRVLGPNTVGMFNALTGAFANFGITKAHGEVPKGNIAIVTQSGAFCTYLYTLAVQNQIGLNYFIGTGNEADIDVAECIAYLAEDPKTDVIACYIEGIKDGEKFLKSLDLAKRYKKPVIIYKVGRTEIGRKAALSHTASLAGTETVWEAVFKQTSAYRVDSIQELLDVASACSYSLFPQGKRVAIFTISGGAGVMLADHLTELGLELSQPSEETKKQLLQILPHASVMNPIDLTGQLVNKPELMLDFMKTTLDKENYDLIITFIAAQGYIKSTLEKHIETFKEIRTAHSHIPQLLTTIVTPETKKMINDAGIAVFNDPLRIAKVAKALCQIGANFTDYEKPRSKWEKKTRKFNCFSDGILTEYNSKQILQDYDIPVTREIITMTQKEAIKAANDIGYPVVLKGLSPQIPHKTEMGLVHLNVKNDEGIVRIYETLRNNIKKVEGADFEGVLVQEMLEPATVEMIIGSKTDPQFGPVVMVGIGGIFVEVINDVSVRMAPVNNEEARNMILELKSVSLLQGARGKAHADIEALCETVVALSRLAADYKNQIEEIDLNPLMVYPQGKGVRAADALIKLKRST
ncbi:hypothetical protein DCC39_08470 [Pueribacillus theae]|uniref:ATP-grasp domain-containing protein n=1 Tax=Pueribacillus theae TaxID=2171751 RepID=A0A2U1K4T4_9BACI|nr:acetate--CoA ligase family protein [Pueribacillus theae]PWA11958.1 hypothetical protein DCC39_08470 [Pueribacillus theae]